MSKILSPDAIIMLPENCDSKTLKEWNYDLKGKVAIVFDEVGHVCARTAEPRTFGASICGKIDFKKIPMYHIHIYNCVNAIYLMCFATQGTNYQLYYAFDGSLTEKEMDDERNKLTGLVDTMEENINVIYQLKFDFVNGNATDDYYAGCVNSR
jgi:hypothetical protein